VRQPLDLFHGRRGFTFVEVLLVMALMGIILAIGVPKLANAQRHGTVRTSTQKVQSYLVTARLTAMRRGQPTTFHAIGNDIWITSETTAGVTDTVGRRISLGSELGVTLTADVPTVRFTSRGFTDLNGRTMFRVARTGYADSVCVSRAGIVGRCGF
jgi:prepilin-type N-terminal cleavage/methylation domain-containing protein